MRVIVFTALSATCAGLQSSALDNVKSQVMSVRNTAKKVNKLAIATHAPVSESSPVLPIPETIGCLIDQKFYVKIQHLCDNAPLDS